MGKRSTKKDEQEAAPGAGAAEHATEPSGIDPTAQGTPPNDDKREPASVQQTSDVFAGIAELPTPQEHAINNITADEAQTAQPGTPAPSTPVNGPVDADGRGFDASIHETNPDGSPRLSPSGKLRKKRGRGASTFTGAKPAASTATAGGPTQGSTPPAVAPPTEQELDLAAKSLVNTTFLASVMFFGPKDGELEESEIKESYSTYKNYMAVRGIIKIPPEFAVIGLLVKLGATRWNRPEVVKRRASMTQRFTAWYLRLRGKIPPKEAEQTEAKQENKEAQP